MDRINKILLNRKYKESLEKIKLLEKRRIFCKHSIEHFLDTARIAYIMCLEQNITINKEIIYAFGILHDIGKGMQYEMGIPHHEASANIAKELLNETGFNEEEIDCIISAILSHRKDDEQGLSSIFYKADKMSRLCFKCDAQEECNWSDTKKNLTLKL